MKLGKLGFKLKIAAGFGSLLAIIAGMGLVGYRSAEANEKLAQEARLDARLMAHSHELLEEFLLQRIGTRDVLMGRDQENTRLLEQGETQFRGSADDLQTLLATDTTRDLFARVNVAYSNYTRRNHQVVTMYRAGDTQTAINLFKDPERLTATTALTNALKDMTAQVELDRHNVLVQQVASNARTRQWTLMLALFGLAIGSAIALTIARSIVHAIQQMSVMIETVSSNNLMVEDMEVKSDDEMGRAAFGLNKMKNSLREVILSIASTAEEVSQSSREISVAASHAADSAEDQKQQVEQVATTMQEMAATVREVSRHANTAARSASSAADSARDGGRIVEDVRERMRGIAVSVGESAANIEHLGAKSDQIGRIVEVIDEIANQTNLLALNAAIEAARAGEQGRGFAVVAGEVRRLAERTTAATREIAAVIQDVQSVTADAVRQMRSGTAVVEQGVEATGKAGDSIQRIIREADNVGAMVAQIASAATQQATATEEVTASMGQISGLAVESADGSQLSARACGQLLNLALGLENTVDRFDVGRHEGEESDPVAA